MSPKWIMFIAGVFIVGNLLCLVLDGGWYGAEDTSVMGALTGAQVHEVGGFWGVVSAGVSFIGGLIRMLFWDYSFFDGDLQIVQWILSILTIGTIYGLLESFIPGIPNLITRR